MIDALVRTHIHPQGLKLICISAINAIVAIVIGLAANALRGGTAEGPPDRNQGRGQPASQRRRKNEKARDRDGEGKEVVGFVAQAREYVPRTSSISFSRQHHRGRGRDSVWAALRGLRKHATPGTSMV